MFKEIKRNTNYMINEFGNVYSIRSKRCIKPRPDKDGYLKIILSNHCIKKQYFIHRLVAEAFLENKENKPTVDHIDGDILNNHYTNLRWATYSEQNKNPHWQRAMRKPIISIENNCFYEGLCTMHEKTGFNKGHVSECLHGTRKTCGGFHWRYATPEETELYYNSIKRGDMISELN